MMDYSITCLTIGDSRYPHSLLTNSNIFFSQWLHSAPGGYAPKELELLGRSSLFELEQIHPCFLRSAIAAVEELPLLDQLEERKDYQVEDAPRNLHELPLFWQAEEEQHGVEDMDDSLWSNLPHDAIERIVAFLHVPNALRTSVVSKQWKAIMSSPSFLSACAQSRLNGSYFLVFQCGRGGGKSKEQSTWLAAYDSSTSKWYSMSLNFLPSPPTAPFSDYTVVSASGGLLCLWPEPRKPWKSVGLVVCNPVTRRWKELPCRCHDSRMPDLVSMSVDNATGSYKVLVISEAVSDSKAIVATELYDSRIGAWKLTSIDTNLEGKYDRAVACGCMVFCLFEEAASWYKIKGYDLEDQTWKLSISLPMVFYENQEVMEAPDILECNGRLLLIGRVGKSTCTGAILIWELDTCLPNKWREVERMPHDIAREFLGCLVFGHYYCIARGDLIFFVASFKAHLLVFSITKKTWQWWDWPFYEKHSIRFPIFGFVKPPPKFPPFGFALDLRFDALV